ncbi:hypothetical protein BS47DRAFT_1370984 [Hydnum rufescens UP504]|uniref:Amidohydrolase-related domain-containing protein n=1 Tax=Hydnum rufescens UP504 TaxID=1448309 RepID=A0A9P6B6Z3_9AGAM|nr:hypothetical protein BS47DRAFT_1370984 [Hydnum rufescens UP504]
MEVVSAPLFSLSASLITALGASPALLAVSDDGLIAWVEKDVPLGSIHEFASKHDWIPDKLVVAGEGEWIMPGFVDTHTHASQFPMLGTGGQYELLDWLRNITFPGEERFADVAYAQRTYQDVVRRIINCGTTTCCYYATLHLEGSKVLADVVHEKGQRAFVGKCNMDRNSPPTYVESSPEISVEDTQKFIQHIQEFELDHTTDQKPMIPLVQPILTPRFAISCSDHLLASVGHIFDASSQTTKNNYVAHTYTSIYDHFSLLAPRTILAHGVHLTDPELDLIHMRGVGLSHCAGSNFNLRSGVASVGKWLERGIKVGLGTDVSGGITPSILTEIRHTSIASKVRAMMDVPPSTESSPVPVSSTLQSPFTSPQGLPLPTLLYLATLGGADVCNLAHRIGTLTPGKEFDALHVSLPPGHREPRPVGESLETMLERFLFGGDDRNIRKVWVRGRLIGGTDLTLVNA